MPNNTSTKIFNQVKIGLFCIGLGSVVGIIVWIFLKIMSLGLDLIWHEIPSKINFPLYTLVVCTVGGLIIGLLHKFFGDYPEELEVVLGKIKTDKTYDYKKMAPMLLLALLPLLFGSSVGPEAGLTGIIVGLCYWMGDNIKSAFINVKEYSKVGMAATLSVMFRSPLFGIFAVEESDEPDTTQIKKSEKLVLYGLSTAGVIATYLLLSKFFGSGMSGFPTFPVTPLAFRDYLMVLIYIPCGCILALFYNLTHKYILILSHKIPVILRECIGGICLGAMGTILPILMFSGEHEMGLLIAGSYSYLPAILILVSFLKILLTNVCISTGLRGGHFFPVIFAGVCMGYGLSMLIFPGGGHEVFAAAVITATLLGGIMKKPLAVTVLLFICFPVRLFFWIFIAAAIGKAIMNLTDKKKHTQHE